MIGRRRVRDAGVQGVGATEGAPAASPRGPGARRRRRSWQRPRSRSVRPSRRWPLPWSRAKPARPRRRSAPTFARAAVERRPARDRPGLVPSTARYQQGPRAACLAAALRPTRTRRSARRSRQSDPLTWAMSDTTRVPLVRSMGTTADADSEHLVPEVRDGREGALDGRRACLEGVDVGEHVALAREGGYRGAVLLSVLAAIASHAGVAETRGDGIDRGHGILRLPRVRGRGCGWLRVPAPVTVPGAGGRGRAVRPRLPGRGSLAPHDRRCTPPVR